MPRSLMPRLPSPPPKPSPRGLLNAPQTQYAASGGRGLLNGGQTQYPTAGGRGLLNAQPAYAPPAYAAQAAAPYPYKSYVLQYHPPAAAAGGPYRPAPYGYGTGYAYGYAYAPSSYEQSYTLDAGDKLRVIVFGQQGISGTYTVDAGGNIDLPLGGTIKARGFTTRQVGRAITDRLSQGYVRNPHVTVSIEAYRPFFILGEVTTPGKYAYVPNMTVENAVAVAGGFSPRAYKDNVEVTRSVGGQRLTTNAPLGYRLRPGDTIVVKERWF